MRETAPHLEGIDNLRFVLVLLVVATQGALSYGVPGSAWWVVRDTSGSPWVGLLGVLLELPLLPILCFIAGYFAVFSVSRRGAGAFMVQKVRCLAPLWIAGVLVAAPLPVHLGLLARGERWEGLRSWWPRFFTSLYHQSVYGFLGLLLVFFLILAVASRIPAFARWLDQEPPENCERCRRERWRGVLLLYCLTSLGVFLVHRRVPLDGWGHWNYLFMEQPLRIPLYGGYFLYGLVAGRGLFLHREWLRGEKAWPRLSLWLPLGLVFLVGYGANRLGVLPEQREDLVVQAATALLMAGMTLSWLMVALALARCGLERRGRIWRRGARNALGIYCLHPLVLAPVVFLLRGVPRVPPEGKFLLAVTVTVMLSLALSEGWLILIRGFRKRSPG
ncbi:Acyltransferase family protein [Alkalispirochaeta americana]|uniref:Acyltransferase family protein n=1 Tax=Alkalispirochaeta americana TaxID=159291 RepID=A0A1N6TJC2_9SPIO|nr:acyltransferase family protein [Alkalispirochaeta americana]SIQ53371.1 Acyltransferase family protein [Alkalispirochaeta americana]